MTKPYSWAMLKNPDKFSPTPLRTLDCRCYHCGQITRMPMTGVESEEGAYWRSKYDRLMGQMNEALADVRQEFGVDPIAVVMTKKLIALRDKFGCSDP